MTGDAPKNAWNQPDRAHRVYIIDDDSDVRKSLHFLLSASSVTAWPFATAADFIDQLDELEPAPILLDKIGRASCRGRV